MDEFEMQYIEEMVLWTNENFLNAIVTPGCGNWKMSRNTAQETKMWERINKRMEGVEAPF